MSASYRIEFMNRAQVLKTMAIEGEPLEEAIEVAEAGMDQYEAISARIFDEAGAEVWSSGTTVPKAWKR